MERDAVPFTVYNTEPVDMNERIRCALSLALQFVPVESKSADEQADIDLIHDLVAGRAIAWDELDRVRRREAIEAKRALEQATS